MDTDGELTPAAGKKPMQRRRRWTPDEHQRFLEALHMYGRDWKMIEEHVGTRTTIQLRSHAQKYFENARKLGVAGLPPPRPRRRRKHAVPQQPQSSTAEQPPPDMQSFDWARMSSGTSASAWLNHASVGIQTEQVAATYPDDNSFMGTASFFSAMTMDMEWAGTSSTTEASAPPASSLPDFKTMLACDDAELEPWDIIMQEIRDMGLELDLDLSVSPSTIHEGGGSESHQEVPAYGCDTDFLSQFVWLILFYSFF
ncbi:unnamed protein product [Alopecurus aequalis]